MIDGLMKDFTIWFQSLIILLKRFLKVYFHMQFNIKIKVVFDDI